MHNALGWAVACIFIASSARAQETTVRASRDGEDVVSSTAMATETVLWQQPGMSLLSTGGPLAPSRMLVRGLGGARLRVTLWGDDVAGVLDGDVDAAALPWLLTTTTDVGANVDAIGGRLRFVGLPSSMFAIEASSFDTLRARAAWQTSGRGWRSFIAADVGASGGRFLFSPTTSVSDGVQLSDKLRDNNDQQRAWLLAGVDAGSWRLRAAVRGHEGGVPGFALAPPLLWRGRDAQALMSAQGQHRIGGLQVVGRASLQRQQRDGWLVGDNSPSSVRTTSVAGSLQVAAPLADFAHGRLQAGVAGHHLEVVERQRTLIRMAPFATTTITVQPIQQLPWVVMAAARIEGASDQRGGIGSGGAQLALSRLGAWSPRIQVSMSGRAPTLDELYAPRGVVMGNATLGPERVHEVEAGVRGASGDASCAVTAFAAELQQPIVYVHYNAYDIAPINLGAVHRAGVEAKVAAMTPPGWLRWRGEVAATWFASAQQGVAMTQPQSLVSAPFGQLAPLPNAATATAFATLTAIFSRDVRAGLSLRARSPSSANRFGTLTAPGYALFAAHARIPLASNLVATASIDNVFDVRTARDTNLLPLPGRMWTMGLEVSP